MKSVTEFKDHFSTQSKTYSKYRPEYPEELYSYLADICAARELAWDCATGNGQAARGLDRYFDQVHATDASSAQIANAHGSSSINFQIADAAGSGLADGAVDLVTVAQALHWFNLDEFYSEVKRVLKPNGVLAVWSYQGMEIDPKIDPLIWHYYHKIIGDYWPPERSHIEDRYSSLKFPFTKLKVPSFTMEVKWSLEHLIGYLESWSSTTRYIQDRGENPLIELREKIAKIWGDSKFKKGVWPIALIVGRNSEK